MSTQTELICLACGEEPRAALTNGQLGPMCSECQKAYDENTRDLPQRKCSQCRQMRPEFEFKKKNESSKMCSFCRAEFSERAKVAQAAREDRAGVTDADLRMAYVRLYRSYKDGCVEPGAMIGPVVEVLVAVGSAESAGNGCYRITDAGLTIWAHMATQTAGKFDIDRELMERAGWIMSIQALLEALEDESWQTLKVKIAYDVRAEAKAKGWVEVSGKTVAQQYHITNAGVNELARLRAEAAAPNGFTVLEFGKPESAQSIVDATTVTNLPRVYTDEVAKRMADLEPQAAADDAPEDLAAYLAESLEVPAGSPQRAQATVIEVDLRDEIERLKRQVDELDSIITQHEKTTGPISVMMREDLTPDEVLMVEYVAALRMSNTTLTAQIGELLESVKHLGGIEAEMETVMQWALSDGSGEAYVLDYIESLRGDKAILDELSGLNLRFEDFIKAARAKYAALVALKGE